MIGQTLVNILGCANGVMYTGLAGSLGIGIGSSIVKDLTPESREVTKFKEAEDIVEKVSYLAKIVLGSAVLGAALGAALGVIPGSFIMFFRGSFPSIANLIISSSVLGHVAGLVAGIAFAYGILDKVDFACNVSVSPSSSDGELVYAEK